MKKFYIVLLAISTFFTGCGSPAPEVKKQVEKQTPVKKYTQKTSSIPAWVHNPDMDGYTGSVGIVKLMKNKKKQNYIAKKLAVAELQERKRVMISSSVNNKKKVKNGKIVESESTHTLKQTSSHFNSDVIVQKAEYSDDESYYVWMVVKQ